MTVLKLKRIHPKAIIPTQRNGDVGFDLYSAADYRILPHSRQLVKTGWILAEEPIVSGSCIHGNLRLEMKIEARSGLALHHGVWPIGGIIDPSYRGELGVILYNSTFNAYDVKCGDKIAQLVLYPVVANWSEFGRKVDFEEVDTVHETERSESGFGSTGK